MERDLELLFELGTLRHLPRAWQQFFGVPCANVLEHTTRVCVLALMLARRAGLTEDATVLKMALFHDIAETRTLDLAHAHKSYTTRNESAALHDMLAGTSLGEVEEIVAAFDRRDSLAAKIVKDADILDIDLELKELEARGHALPAAYAEYRLHFRDTRLVTDEAKAYFDALQTADPAAWHLEILRTQLQGGRAGQDRPHG